MLEKIKGFLFKNTTASQTVAKNTFWLSVSNLGGRLIKAAVVIYAARALGTAAYGVFSYAITLAGFFSLFIDPGINGIVMRDASKGDREAKFRVFSTAFYIKLTLLAAGICIIIFIGPYFSSLPGAQVLLPVVACILVLDNFREFLFSFIRTMEKMEWEAGIFLFLNTAIVVFGFIALAIRPTALAFGWGYTAGIAIGTIVALFVLRDYLKPMISNFSKKLVAPIFHAAWPFAITGALGILLTNTDILIISWMRSASDVGIYSAAIRIVQTFYLIPVIIQFSALPLFSRLAGGMEHERFSGALERIVSTLFLMSVPLALGGAVLGTQVMQLIFGADYASGGLPLKILMITMLVDFPAAILSTAIFAHQRQKNLIVSSAIGGVANVALDLLLIPPFGIAGSAVATLIAQSASSWYLWHTMDRINPFSVVPRLGRIVLAGMAMAGAAAILLATGMNVILNVLISAGFYLLLLKVLREPTLGELKNILANRNAEATSEAS